MVDRSEMVALLFWNINVVVFYQKKISDLARIAAKIEIGGPTTPPPSVSKYT